MSEIRESGGGRRLPAALALTAALLVAVAASALPAGAQSESFPPRFWDRCDEDEPAGQQCNGQVRGVAANPQNGRVYLADQTGKRIIEYSAWGEFRRTWGWDVVETGPGDTPADEFEVCVSPDDTCKDGVSGDGPGQLSIPVGLAVDSAGDLYVVDRTNRWVQKFDLSGPELAFAWAAGAGVNQGGGSPSSPGDLCIAQHLADGDLCGAGVEGTGPGQFSDMRHGDYIAVDDAGTATTADDSVWVGDQDRIQRLSADGAYQDEIAIAGETPKALEVDSGGDLYVSYASGSDPNTPAKDDVHKLSAAGAPLATFSVETPNAVAVDPDGNLYVFSRTVAPGGGSVVFIDPIFKFAPDGSLLENFGIEEFGSSLGIATNAVSAEGEVALYVSNSSSSQPITDTFLRAYSPAPDAPGFDPPPPVAPSVEQEFATSVAVSDATVGAEINPRFWADTSYYVEYGDAGPCDANPCAEVGAPGISLDAGVVDTAKRAEVALGGLDPDTTYHFRFIAQSSGGGPTFGAGGSFTTFPEAPEPASDCPNQELRSGPAARLPDCRAFELVSPIDKNGGNVRRSLLGGTGDLAAADGEGYSYLSKTAFADAVSAPIFSNYIASRDPEAGWSTHALNPPRQTLTALGITTEFRAHSPDLAHSWIRTSAEPTPDPAAPAGYMSFYRRDNATGAYTAMSTVTPPTAGEAGGGSEAFYPRLGGWSADGTRTVFSANDRLVAAASGALDDTGKPIRQLYEQRDGQPLRLVSVLPGGSASDEDSAAGGATSHLAGAVSADGERIYWTAGHVSDGADGAVGGCYCGTAQGRIYVRVGGSETAAVSETVDGADARFWAAASDGSGALFSFLDGAEEGNLYRFDLASESSTLIASGVVGVGGFADDLGAGYLVSTEVLDPGPNSEGDTASADGENVFHYDETEGFSFVASPGFAFGAEDARVVYDSDLTTRLSQVSPDGRTLAFVTPTSLTGYDNRDPGSGERAFEVFRHSAESGELRCVSCDPSGARPEGPRLVISPFALGYPTAGWIPGWNTGPFGPQRAMSADGRRIFFEAFDDILPGDANGKVDVYEWQAPGSGECTTQSAYYFESNGGCLALISTGRSSGESTFGDATPDGETVFIRTGQSLLPQDPGLYDIYAARVGGGFPQPSAPPPCEGDGCQPPATDPDPDTPGSEGFEGASDPAVPPDCRSATAKAEKAGRQAGRAKRKAKHANRRAKRAHGKRTKRLRRKAQAKRKAAKRAKKKARKLDRRAGRCRSGSAAAQSGRWGL